MKKLSLLAVCIFILSLSGCANGLLSGCGNSCNQGGLFSGGMFQGNGPLADGPVRQWLRGDECNTCNPAAEQLGQPAACGCDSNVSATCAACGQGVANNGMGDAFAQPMMGQPIMGQPVTGQPMINQQFGQPTISGPTGGTVNSFYPDFNGNASAALDSDAYPAANDVFATGDITPAVQPPFNGSIDFQN